MSPEVFLSVALTQASRTVVGRWSEGSGGFPWGGGPHTPAESIIKLVYFLLRNGGSGVPS